MMNVARKETSLALYQLPLAKRKLEGALGTSDPWAFLFLEPIVSAALH
jgi:hypothetical protein